jgi:nitric oxide reductase activation protein
MSAARHHPTGAEAAEGQANVPPNTSTDSEDDEGSVASRRTSDRTPSIKKEHSLASLLVKKLSTRKAKGDTSGAGSGQVSLQRVSALDPDARPVPVPVRFTDEGLPSRLAGASGALYPEWDAGSGRYRPYWCLVSDFTVEPLAGAAEIRVSRDEELRRRLSTLGLGPTRGRRRPDGDDLDVDALVDVATGLRAGYSAGEAVYIERRQIARDLGVLILLDASGSAAEIDPDGRSVHELQRQTAATLAVTLEELGDRVAVYGFRSHGRSAVHLVSIKRFNERFGAAARANLKQLESAGYTRLGAAVRHAGELLKADAGTPFRLLLVLSDGFPFDAGYREAYAEADVRKALEELRRDGVACLCLSIGASTSTDVLARVFGTASHAHAATLQALSPHMDELFVGALRELAVSS